MNHHNNFNLIRLFAATQVVLVHAFYFTSLATTGPAWSRPVFDLVLLFPGVPIFFVCSGFLIAMSWEHSTGFGRYCWKRCLRIYPALFVCVAVALVILLFAGFLPAEFVRSGTFIGWLAGQLTFVQFFNPEAFRGFGVGVVNGALWTIAVELQFYLFIPLFAKLVFGKWKRSRAGTLAIAAVFLTSLGAHQLLQHGIHTAGGFHGAPFGIKLLHNTLAPHLWIFLLGVFAYRQRAWLLPKIEGRALPFLAAYAVVAIATADSENWGALGRLVPIPLNILMALTTLSVAFSGHKLSAKLLRGHDYSYGIYLYHYLAINILIEWGKMGTMFSIVIVFGLTAAAAVLSWRFVEKPAMRLKNWIPQVRLPRPAPAPITIPGLPQAPLGMDPSFGRRPVGAPPEVPLEVPPGDLGLSPGDPSERPQL